MYENLRGEVVGKARVMMVVVVIALIWEPKCWWCWWWWWWWWWWGVVVITLIWEAKWGFGWIPGQTLFAHKFENSIRTKVFPELNDGDDDFVFGKKHCSFVQIDYDHNCTITTNTKMAVVEIVVNLYLTQTPGQHIPIQIHLDQLHKYTNKQIHKYTNKQIHKYTNKQIHK